MPAKKTIDDDRIIELRKEGLTCRAVAERMGISIDSVAYCMKKHGLVGKWRGNSTVQRRRTVRRPNYRRAFSIMILGNDEVMKVMPTSKRQFDSLLAMLQKEGGQVI